jgi:levanase/fructan beta-fructosidase
MVLAANDKIMFYASDNLKDWDMLSDFGKDIGAHGGVWECPDFFPLQVQGSDEKKWILLVSINPGGPNGGSSTQYFIGDFDGKSFTIDENFKNELQKEHDFWVDFGKDNYAGVTWSNTSTSDGGKLFMGWMSNWQYANKVPTEKWRSAMTIARELRLIKTNKSYRLIFEPVNELNEYRGKKFKKDGITIKDKDGVKIIDSKFIDLTSALIKFNISDSENNSFNFKLSNKTGDELSFGYNHTDNSFYINRKRAGKTDFSENFGNKISTAPRISPSKNLNGTILLDKTSIELFFDDGKTVMTEIFFPNAPFDTFSVESKNEEFVIDHIEIHELKFN